MKNDTNSQNSSKCVDFITLSLTSTPEMVFYQSLIARDFPIFKRPLTITLHRTPPILFSIKPNKKYLKT